MREIDNDVHIKRGKLAESQNDIVLLARPSSVLFRGYKLDSSSRGLSNIRWRYSQLVSHRLRYKYFSYPICGISHVRLADATISRGI